MNQLEELLLFLVLCISCPIAAMNSIVIIEIVIVMLFWHFNGTRLYTGDRRPVRRNSLFHSPRPLHALVQRDYALTENNQLSLDAPILTSMPLLWYFAVFTRIPIRIISPYLPGSFSIDEMFYALVGNTTVRLEDVEESIIIIRMPLWHFSYYRIFVIFRRRPQQMIFPRGPEPSRKVVVSLNNALIRNNVRHTADFAWRFRGYRIFAVISRPAAAAQISLNHSSGLVPMNIVSNALALSNNSGCLEQPIIIPRQLWYFSCYRIEEVDQNDYYRFVFENRITTIGRWKI